MKILKMTMDNIQDCIEQINRQGFEFHLVVNRPSSNGVRNIASFGNFRDPSFFKLVSDIAIKELVEQMNRNFGDNPDDSVL